MLSNPYLWERGINFFYNVPAKRQLISRLKREFDYFVDRLVRHANEEKHRVYAI